MAVTAKRPVRKVARPKKAAATKAAPKKTAPAKKAAVKAKVSPAKTESTGRKMDKYGFVVGTDSHYICKAIMEGGASREEVNEKAAALVAEHNGGTTRHGTPKNIPALSSGIINRLLAAGYSVKSAWKVVPPEGGAVPAAARETKSAPTKKTAAKKAPAKKAAVKKAPAKKAAVKAPAKKTAAKRAVKRPAKKAARSK